MLHHADLDAQAVQCDAGNWRAIDEYFFFARFVKTQQQYAAGCQVKKGALSVFFQIQLLPYP